MEIFDPPKMATHKAKPKAARGRQPGSTELFDQRGYGLEGAVD
jgi:hypothetical protein